MTAGAGLGTEGPGRKSERPVSAGSEAQTEVWWGGGGQLFDLVEQKCRDDTHSL